MVVGCSRHPVRARTSNQVRPKCSDATRRRSPEPGMNTAGQADRHRDAVAGGQRHRLADATGDGRVFPRHEAGYQPACAQHPCRGRVGGEFSCQGFLDNCYGQEELSNEFLQPDTDPWLPGAQSRGLHSVANQSFLSAIFRLERTHSIDSSSSAAAR